jgi:DNA-binding GntR family transcriptional regulator
MSNAAVFRQPLARTSLAEAAYEQLLDAILSGRLRSGTELSEVQLAAELQVSRTPIHEALRRLSADGLVRITSSRQACVAEFTSRDVAAIYEMRMLLESAAVERATRLLTDEALEDLHEAAASLADPESRGWTSRALQFDTLFHDRIAAACGNDRLRDDIRKYRHLVRALCRLTGNVDNLRAAYDEHLVILRAMQARQPAAAAQAMSDHIANRLAAVLRELPADVAS